jgi:L-rhamnonate dehydratase
LLYAFTNCPIAEFLVMSPQADRLVPIFGDLFKDEPLPVNGHICLSDAPGWGVELNDKLELARPYARSHASDKRVAAREASTNEVV